MKKQETFAGIAALAVIIALSWLVVPTAGAGDKGHRTSARAERH